MNPQETQRRQLDKKIKLLTNKQQKSYENAKMSYICKGKFEGKHDKDRKHSKVKDHCHYTGECRGAAHSIYSVPKEISKTFQNRSNQKNLKDK